MAGQDCIFINSKYNTKPHDQFNQIMSALNLNPIAKHNDLEKINSSISNPNPTASPKIPTPNPSQTENTPVNILLNQHSPKSNENEENKDKN